MERLVGTIDSPIVAVASLVVAAGMVAAGCKPQYTRGSEKKDLDDPAMSLRLDRKDINKLYDENIDALMNSSVVREWNRTAKKGEAPVVAVLPFHNDTGENVEGGALLSKFETDLVNNTAVDVIDRDRQPELIKEVKSQQQDAYNPRRIASYGRQLGAQYFLTGKIHGVREQVKKEKRQQYFMFVQVINVATSAIEFQHESKVTKGFVK